MSQNQLPFDPIAEARRQWDQRWDAGASMAASTSVMRVQQIVLSRVDAALRDLGLTFARYEVLVLLHFSRRGSLPMGKMGERLMIHPTSVTNLVDRLEDSGLVRRTAHPSDRRTTLAEITPAGRRLVERATKRVTEVQLGLQGLDARELDQLSALLRKVRINAGDYAPATTGTSVPPTSSTSARRRAAR